MSASRLPQASDPTSDEWAEWFTSFDRILLIANSEDVVRAALPEGDDRVLHVFFNRVFKVLDEPFDGPSLLVARCSGAGPNLVYRGEVDAVLQLLSPAGRYGVLQLRASESERFGPDEAFGGTQVSRLDLAGWFDGIYPRGDIPTSGFALVTWLLDRAPSARLELHGFSARRSSRWKLFDDHDWTFEQIALASLEAAGRIVRVGKGDADWPLGNYLERQGIGTLDAALAARVLSERLRGTNLMLDRVWSVLKPMRWIDDRIRALKPQTRKQRIADDENSHP